MTLRKLSKLGALGLLALVGAAPLSVGGCDAKVKDVLSSEDGGPSADGGGLADEDRPLVPASKIDILLVVDNSAAMGDKATALAGSLGAFLRRITPGKDVHLGVITSSLGNSGGDVCDEQGAPRTNDRGRLRTTGPKGQAVPGAETGVVSYAGGSDDAFVATAETLVRGVGETGCGLEAQLEAMYRFLVQPDPWGKVVVADAGQARLEGVDVTVLAQRKAFLRPDSAVVVLMLTDEDDASLDPRAFNGQGWAFAAQSFPGSKVQRVDNNGSTAPRGIAACATDPGSDACTSCAIATEDPSCAANSGYFAAGDDSFNVRFFDMKRRYGVDPQFPIKRYVDGLTKSVVPDRASEHAVSAPDGPVETIEPYTGTPTCSNPLFAATLPSDATSELCTLERGPRSKELVLFAVLGGVPSTLVGDWDKVLGKNRDAFDTSGIDPHMIQSIEPRAGLPGPTEAASDPIHGREYDTYKGDLQYACTYALPYPRACNRDDASCDCAPGRAVVPPLCEGEGNQVRAKAYPTIRPLRVAQGLGHRAVVGSICSTDYAATMTSLGDRLAPLLAP